MSTDGSIRNTRSVEAGSGSRLPKQESVASQASGSDLDLASILEAVRTLSSETALPRLMDTLTRILVENAGAEHGCLLLPIEGQWQVLAAGPNREACTDVLPGLPAQPSVAMSIVSRVAQSHELLLFNDVSEATSLSQDPHVLAVRPLSILSLPLLHDGKLEGVFYMESRLTRHAFPPERLQALTLLASHAAIALRNASLVTRLQEARDEILTSEQHFRFLFENAPFGMIEIDISDSPAKLLAANRLAQAAFGWSAAEFVDLNPTVLIPDENRLEIEHLVETVRSGKAASIETVNQRRDGTRFPVRVVAIPASDLHGMHMIVAVEDITAQRQRRSEAEAIDAERRRIAHEIHDGVAQDLAALRLKLALWRDWVGSDHNRMQRELDQTQSTLDGAIAEIRRAIYALRPLALDEMGLLPALRRYVADLNERHEVYVDLHIDVPEEHLPADLELPLFRAMQEGLNNYFRHAEASLVRVRLETRDDKMVVLTIADNGLGFDVSALGRAGQSGHFGLLQMRERIERAGGALRVASQPGQGTQIHVQLPLE